MFTGRRVKGHGVAGGLCGVFMGSLWGSVGPYGVFMGSRGYWGSLWVMGPKVMGSQGQGSQGCSGSLWGSMRALWGHGATGSLYGVSMGQGAIGVLYGVKGHGVTGSRVMGLLGVSGVLWVSMGSQGQGSWGCWGSLWGLCGAPWVSMGSLWGHGATGGLYGVMGSKVTGSQGQGSRGCWGSLRRLYGVSVGLCGSLWGLYGVV